MRCCVSIRSVTSSLFDTSRSSISKKDSELGSGEAVMGTVEEMALELLEVFFSFSSLI